MRVEILGFNEANELISTWNTQPLVEVSSKILHFGWKKPYSDVASSSMNALSGHPAIPAGRREAAGKFSRPRASVPFIAATAATVVASQRLATHVSALNTAVLTFKLTQKA
jgi:hypothetical protein